MTSRERMHMALEGGKPDQVPVAPYIWGAEFVWKLMGKPIWQVQLGSYSTLDYCEAIQRRYECDWVIPLSRGEGFLEGKEVVEEGGRVWISDPKTGRKWEFLSDGHLLVEMDAAGQPMTDEATTHGVVVENPPTTKAEVDAWFERRRQNHPGRWDQPPAPDFRRRFPDTFLIGRITTCCYAVGTILGFDTALILLHEHPEVFCYMAEKILEGLPERCQRLAQEGCDAGFTYDLWCSADVISPATYRNWIAPLHRQMSDEMHRAGLKSILYFCGNILPMLPAFKELGWDAITFEEQVKGTEQPIAEVRKILGPKQCIFGNFDAYVLLSGDKAKIESEVRRQIETAGKDGAFVMGIGSPVCDGTDPEIVDFWIKTTRQIGRYNNG